MRQVKERVEVKFKKGKNEEKCLTKISLKFD